LDLHAFKLKAKYKHREIKEFTMKLKKSRPKNLDVIFHQSHEEVFSYTDCLECANCCKTTSPIFQKGDIERLAKVLKMKVPQFIEEYLHIDEDEDYVLNSSPCPFLGYENKCIVYKDRPTACREYPHTNRKRMYQLMDLSIKNSQVCPAVLDILDKVKKNIK
jgi:Fe-S-cluster containining protein